MLLGYLLYGVGACPVVDILDWPSMLSERAASCNSQRTVRPQGCTAAERP